jgi:hypothetical protein
MLNEDYNTALIEFFTLQFRLYDTNPKDDAVVFDEFINNRQTDRDIGRDWWTIEYIFDYLSEDVV